MWTDLAAAYFPASSYLLWIGAQLIAGGIVCIWLNRRDLILGPDPQPPAVAPVDEQPVVAGPPSPPPNYRRADSDTGVVPRIPGATPVLSPQLRAVARMLDNVDQASDETVEIVTAFDQIEGLRVIPSAGPVCPTCGGPYGACTCYGQKSSSDKGSEPTQVVELCPLTTQDIEVPTYGHTPVHREIADREPTREMSGTVAKILEATK